MLTEKIQYYASDLAPRKTSYQKSKKVSVPDEFAPSTAPADIMGKLAGMGKAFMSKPMKRPEDW